MDAQVNFAGKGNDLILPRSRFPVDSPTEWVRIEEIITLKGSHQSLQVRRCFSALKTAVIESRNSLSAVPPFCQHGFFMDRKNRENHNVQLNKSWHLEFAMRLEEEKLASLKRSLQLEKKTTLMLAQEVKAQEAARAQLKASTEKLQKVESLHKIKASTELVEAARRENKKAWQKLRTFQDGKEQRQKLTNNFEADKTENFIIVKESQLKNLRAKMAKREAWTKMKEQFIKEVEVVGRAKAEELSSKIPLLNQEAQADEWLNWW